MNEGEMEEHRRIENNEIYIREEVPEDRDENILPNGKNLKNIETEINEEYYDNKGSYLGEKKIITTQQVPRKEYLQKDDEYYEKQEEIEENEINIFHTNHLIKNIGEGEKIWSDASSPRERGGWYMSKSKFKNEYEW